MLLSAVNLAVVNDATDCSAFHVPTILKTFEIRPIGLLSQETLINSMFNAPIVLF